MLSYPLRASLSLLQVAILLASGSGLSGFTHTHSDGDRPHDPEVSPAHHQGVHRHHVDAHDHTDHQHVSDDGDHRVAAGVRHTHCFLFGIGVTLPAEPDHDGDQRHEGPFIHLSTQPSWALATAISVLDSVALLSEGAASKLRLFLDSPDARILSRGHSAQPLCAKARHERSGVQQI